MRSRYFLIYEISEVVLLTALLWFLKNVIFLNKDKHDQNFKKKKHEYWELRMCHWLWFWRTYGLWPWEWSKSKDKGESHLEKIEDNVPGVWFGRKQEWHLQNLARKLWERARARRAASKLGQLGIKPWRNLMKEIPLWHPWKCLSA